jgi:hypothetical protein
VFPARVVGSFSGETEPGPEDFFCGSFVRGALASDAANVATLRNEKYFLA